MDQSRILGVPVVGLPTVVEIVRQRVAGMEAGRRSDCEHRYAGNRYIRAKTQEQRVLESWLTTVGPMIGADVDLGMS